MLVNTCVNVLIGVQLCSWVYECVHRFVSVLLGG